MTGHPQHHHGGGGGGDHGGDDSELNKQPHHGNVCSYSAFRKITLISISHCHHKITFDFFPLGLFPTGENEEFNYRGRCQGLAWGNAAHTHSRLIEPFMSNLIMMMIMMMMVMMIVMIVMKMMMKMMRIKIKMMKMKSQAMQHIHINWRLIEGHQPVLDLSCQILSQ